MLYVRRVVANAWFSLVYFKEAAENLLLGCWLPGRQGGIGSIRWDYKFRDR